MCGILGFNWEDKELAEQLGNLIKHRGPDGEGYFSDRSVTLGHRRLSIIDLSEKGSQPMTNEDKTIWLTYNGEIFNFQEIKKELEAKGHKFNSKTDTEVLIHGYEEYGIKILDKLNGQFAFCLYDSNKRELFLARDRIGINPLYYYFDNKKFIFGSELKVILKSGVPLQINEFAKNHFLVFGHCPRKQSIIDNAFKIEPGHYMIFDLDKNDIKEYKRYWDIKFTSEIKSEEEAVKRIREVFEDAVKIRLVADVPVGAFLSGGVDSSAVVEMISKYKKDLNTFSVKFDYDDFDESAYGVKVAEKFNTKHHIIEFSSKDVKNLLSKLAYHYDEPFADPSMIPTFLVSQVARQYVKVALSGDGGDELFGGYNAYKHYRLIQLTKFYPKIINDFFYRITKNNNFNKSIKAYFEIGGLDKKYARIMSYLSSDEAFEVINKDPSDLYKEYEVWSEKNWLNNAISNDLHNYLPEDILVKVDRASLGNSLESRPPILDHRLIELACKINPALKLKGKEGKYIFKKALSGILPDEIIYRKKMGFGVPLKYYLKNDLKDYVDNLYKNNLEKYGIKKVNVDKRGDNSRLIWSQLILKMWIEKWI